MNEEITDEELMSLSKGILGRYNIDFTHYEPKSLKRRISRAIAVLKMDSLFDLWTNILKDREFVFKFIDEITVGLTSMFRDPTLWLMLKKDILPKFKNKPELNIWHAGCSTGEEVFTMGILLKEFGALNNYKALATDLNQRSIESSKAGVYNLMHMDKYIENYKKFNPIAKFERYYTSDDKNATFDQDLIKHVEFRVHNLVTRKMDRKFDIIFCRNVMIYFDENLKLQLLKFFYDQLNEGGYFIVGFFDAIIPLVDDQLFEIYDLNAKIFRKKAQEKINEIKAA